MKHFERDQMDYVGKDLVLRRLQALAYIDDQGNYVNDDGSTTGTATAAQLASLTGPQGSYASPPSSSALVTADGGNNNSALSGVGDIFTAVFSGVGKTISALNPQRPVALPGQTGSFVYNPQTGQYIPAVQGTQNAQMQTILLFGVLALVIVWAVAH